MAVEPLGYQRKPVCMLVVAAERGSRGYNGQYQLILK